MSFKLTRRQAITAATATSLLAAGPVIAGGHGRKAPMKLAHTFKLGSFGVTTLLDGTMPRDEPQSIFGMNVSADEFSAVSQENFIPSDSTQFFFTPTVVDTGSDVILFDTGLGQGGLQKSLAEADVQVDAVNIVVITHMHPDHIGGLMTDGQPTFPNARYVTASAEYDFWAAKEAGNRVGDMVKQMVTPLADKMTFIEDGGSVASGVTAVAAFGHTPGHMTYMLESDGQQLLLMADLANHYVWSLAYPDWEVRFDMDKAAAAASRRKILGMLAADKIPMIGYHMPFPAAGYVQAREDGFRYVPVSYQLM